MAKKIEGYGLNHGEWIEFDQVVSAGSDWKRATLVLHDDNPERVFTESEVKAIAMQAINMIKSAKKDNIHVGQACGYIGKACIDAGIILDPS